MRERDIRQIIARVCDDLDARAARRVVAPAMLGATLALAAGCGDSDDPSPVDGGGAQPPYQAPDAGDDVAQLDAKTPPDAGQDVDSGMMPVYAASDAGPQPDYMAP